MASNYPPGVTGNEYAIGGATREWEQIAECPHCEWSGYMPHEFHPEIGVRAWCSNPDKPSCIGNREGFEIDPDTVEWDPFNEEDAQ